MASSQTGKPETTGLGTDEEGVTLHSFGCGCLSVSKHGKLREIHWCPYHLAAHGNVVGSESGRARPRPHN